MKTIVHILNTGSFSGAENVVITLIRQMTKQYEGKYHFVYVALEGCIEEYLKEEDITYYPLKKMSLETIQKMLKDVKPNVIHAHDYRASMLTSLVHGKIPMICHLHNNQLDLKKLSLKSLLYLSTTFQYKKIITVSSAVNDEYVFGDLISDKIQVLGNPIDTQRIIKRASEGSGHAFDIVFLGRLSIPKNPIRFINIMNQLLSRNPNLEIAMIGTGELETECRALIHDLGLEKQIHLLGFQKNPYVILKNAKLLCVTSDWEGFGLMVVEAFALGLPVVSTGVGGMKDLITEECGCICKSNDAFIKKIELILQDDVYRKRLSDGAKKRSQKLENIEEYARNVHRIYEDVKG